MTRPNDPSRLERALPLIGVLRGYTRAHARGDAIAGLTVGVMLVPQAMAYAVIAGVPAIYGLYASLVPLLLYPLFGSSRQLAGGPIAIDMLLVASGVSAVAATVPGSHVELAVLLSLLTGLAHLAMWALRLGFVANLLSRPVVTGFTGAAALLIASSQLGNLFGIELERSSTLQGVLASLLTHLGGTNPMALGIGAAGIALMVGLKRSAPGAPRALILMVAATGGSWLAGFDTSGLVEVVGEVPAGLPGLSTPKFSAEAAIALAPAALTLAVVQFMDSASLGRAFAARNGYALRADRELLALGVVNIGGSFASAIPTSASFSRSAVNEQSGAKTSLSNWSAAALVALSLWVLTPVVRHVPNPALAAIIIASCLGLLDLPGMRQLWRIDRREGAEALITFAATLMIGIQQGLIVGLGTSLVLLLYRLGRPRVSELGQVEGEHRWRDLAREHDASRVQGVLALRLEAPLSFLNAERFKDAVLAAHLAHPDASVVLLDVSVVGQLDATGADALSSLAQSMSRDGADLHLCGVIGQVRDTLARSSFSLPPEHIWKDLHDAAAHVRTSSDTRVYDGESE